MSADEPARGSRYSLLLLFFGILAGAKSLALLYNLRVAFYLTLRREVDGVEADEIPVPQKERKEADYEAWGFVLEETLEEGDD